MLNTALKSPPPCPPPFTFTNNFSYGYPLTFSRHTTLRTGRERNQIFSLWVCHNKYSHFKLTIMCLKIEKNEKKKWNTLQRRMLGFDNNPQNTKKFPAKTFVIRSAVFRGVALQLEQKRYGEWRLAFSCVCVTKQWPESCPVTPPSCMPDTRLFWRRFRTHCSAWCVGVMRT